MYHNFFFVFFCFLVRARHPSSSFLPWPLTSRVFALSLFTPDSCVVREGNFSIRNSSFCLSASAAGNLSKLLNMTVDGNKTYVSPSEEYFKWVLPSGAQPLRHFSITFPANRDKSPPMKSKLAQFVSSETKQLQLKCYSWNRSCCSSLNCNIKLKPNKHFIKNELTIWLTPLKVTVI